MRANVNGTRAGGSEQIAAVTAPPWWARLVIYGSLWLPVLAMLLVCARRFKPLFMKLEEYGELPQLTHWLMTYERLNAVCFYLPTLSLVIVLLAVDALVVRHLRRMGGTRIFYWLWVAAVALAAIPAALLVQFGLLSPVFRMVEITK